MFPSKPLGESPCVPFQLLWLLAFLGFSFITLVTDFALTRASPACVCVCVSSLLSAVRVDLGFKTHQQPRMSSCQDPSLIYIYKDPFRKVPFSGSKWTHPGSGHASALYPSQRLQLWLGFLRIHFLQSSHSNLSHKNVHYTLCLPSSQTRVLPIPPCNHSGLLHAPVRASTHRSIRPHLLSCSLPSIGCLLLSIIASSGPLNAPFPWPEMSFFPPTHPLHTWLLSSVRTSQTSPHQKVLVATTHLTSLPSYLPHTTQFYTFLSA